MAGIEDYPSTSWRPTLPRFGVSEYGGIARAAPRDDYQPYNQLPFQSQGPAAVHDSQAPYAPSRHPALEERLHYSPPRPHDQYEYLNPAALAAPYLAAGTPSNYAFDQHAGSMPEPEDPDVISLHTIDEEEVAAVAQVPEERGDLAPPYLGAHSALYGFEPPHLASESKQRQAPKQNKIQTRPQPPPAAAAQPEHPRLTKALEASLPAPPPLPKKRGQLRCRVIAFISTILLMLLVAGAVVAVVILLPKHADDVYSTSIAPSTILHSTATAAHK